MTTEIAKLTVALEAQTAKFAKDMNLVSRRLDSFAKRQEMAARRSSAAWGKFGAQLKGFASAYLGAALFRGIITNTAEAEKSFALLEVAVKNSGNATKQTAEQFSALATELQGASTFSDEAIQDATSLLLKYDELGVSVEEATRLTVDLAARMKKDLPEAAKLVGKALGDPARAMKLLGEAGVVLTKGQKRTITALIESGKQAEASKYLFDELSKASSGAAAAMRDNFGGALEGLKNDFGNLLEAKDGLPGATDAINEFSAVLRDPEFKAGIDAAFGAMLTVLAKIVEALSIILGILPKIANYKLPEWMGGLAVKDLTVPGPLGLAQRFLFPPKPPKQTSGATQRGGATGDSGLTFGTGTDTEIPETAGTVKATEIEKATEAIRKQIEALNMQVIAFGASDVGAAALEVTHGEMAKQFEAMGPAGEVARQKYLELIVALDDLKNAEEAEKKIAEESAALKQEVADALQGLKTDYDLASDAIDKYIGWQQKQLITEEQLQALIKQTSEQLAESAQKAAETTDKMTIQWDQAFRNMQDILADSIFDSFENGTKDMVYQWANALKRMAAEALAANIFGMLGMGASGSGGGGFLQGIFGAIIGGFTGGAGAAAGAASGGGGFGFSMAASGGEFREGEWAMVGERGRELVKFGAPAMVLPNHTTERMMADGGEAARPLNVTFNIETPDADSFMRSQNQIRAKVSTALTRASARNN